MVTLSNATEDEVKDTVVKVTSLQTTRHFGQII